MRLARLSLTALVLTLRARDGDSTIHTESEDGEEVSRANIVSIERDGRVVWDKLSMMKPVYTSHTSHVGDLRVWNCKHTGFNTGESDD